MKRFFLISFIHVGQNAAGRDLGITKPSYSRHFICTDVGSNAAGLEISPDKMDRNS